MPPARNRTTSYPISAYYILATCDTIPLNNSSNHSKQEVSLMRFHIRERAWTLTEAFVVRDDAGNAVFEVRGKFFHIGDDLVIFDRYSGQELARIKQRVLSLMPHYEIYRMASLGPACMSSS